MYLNPIQRQELKQLGQQAVGRGALRAEAGPAHLSVTAARRKSRRSTPVAKTRSAPGCTDMSNVAASRSWHQPPSRVLWALDAASGQWHPTDRERKLAVHFVAFLRHLTAAYPLYLAPDNAQTHTAKVMQLRLVARPRVQVLWVLKYAAHEVNAVERVWVLLQLPSYTRDGP